VRVSLRSFAFAVAALTALVGMVGMVASCCAREAELIPPDLHQGRSGARNHEWVTSLARAVALTRQRRARTGVRGMCSRITQLSLVAVNRAR